MPGTARTLTLCNKVYTISTIANAHPPAKNTMIRSKKDLLAALAADPDAVLCWGIGSTAAERNGVYRLRGKAGEEPVHGAAASAAIRAKEVRQIGVRTLWSSAVYRLARVSTP